MLLLKLKQHYLGTEVADSIETDQLPVTKIVNFKLTIKKIDIEFLKHKTNFKRVTSGAAQSCNDLGGARSEKTARFSSLKGGISRSDVLLAPPTGQLLPYAPPNSLKVCVHSRTTY